MPLLLILSLLGAAAVTGQASQAVRDEFVSLSVTLDVRSPAYTHAGNGDEITVFTASALNVAVTLSNFTNVDTALGSGRRDWTEAVSMSLEKIDDADQQIASPGAIARRVSNRQQASVSRLTAKGRVSDRFVVEGLQAQPLSAGRYRLTVAFDERQLSPSTRRFNNLLRREKTVRIKEPQTSEETLDYYLQMAYQASRAGQESQSRQWLERVLTINPESVVALNDLGTALVRQGNCASGAPFLMKAINVLITGGDRQLLLRGREELAGNIRQFLDSQCRQ